MMPKYLWYAAVILLLGVAYFAFEAGFIMYLWQADLSKLSFCIILIFVKAFTRLGYILHQDRSPTEHDLDPGYEDCDLSMALGMLGTVIGFIAMTVAFSGVDINDIENIKELFSIATHGMSTALLTTAAGLVSSIILRVSYYLTGRYT